MQTEIEAKFLNVDHDKIRDKLRELGAVCEQPMRLMKRKTYDYPDKKLAKVSGWVRLRDEGDKVTLSYKQLNDRSLHGTKEVTVVVNDFAETDKFLQIIGLEARSYQETKRESWTLKEAQIELDEWPWIKPYIEIEAESEEAVRQTVSLLGLDWAEALHGSVEIAYQAEYEVTEEEVDDWPEILFIPVPQWLSSKRKKVSA